MLPLLKCTILKSSSSSLNTMAANDAAFQAFQQQVADKFPDLFAPLLSCSQLEILDGDMTTGLIRVFLENTDITMQHSMMTPEKS